MGFEKKLQNVSKIIETLTHEAKIKWFFLNEKIPDYDIAWPPKQHPHFQNILSSQCT